MIRVLKSNSLDSTNYDGQNLSVKFKDGSLVTYQNVPIHVVEGLHGAKSAGAFFNANIRDSFKLK